MEEEIIITIQIEAERLFALIEDLKAMEIFRNPELKTKEWYTISCTRQLLQNPLMEQTTIQDMCLLMDRYQMNNRNARPNRFHPNPTPDE